MRISDPAGLAKPCEADVVVANILANPLVGLAPELVGHTRQSGVLVLSGILADQADEVAAAYPDFVWDATERRGWVRLTGRRQVD